MTPEDQNEFEERRRGQITIDTLESCLFKALEKYSEKLKAEEVESFRLHQAECPAFQSQKTLKWLVSLPIISTAVVIIHSYMSKKV